MLCFYFDTPKGDRKMHIYYPLSSTAWTYIRWIVWWPKWGLDRGLALWHYGRLAGMPPWRARELFY